MPETKALWMELVGANALVVFMDYKGESVRSLAAKCVVKDPRRPGRHKVLSPQTIGHLRSGKRRTCSVSTAKAIETALDAPPGLLFVPRSTARPRSVEVAA